MSTQTKPVRKPGFPIAAILALVALVAALVAMSMMSQNNVRSYDAHDHNRDGKPDHAAGAAH